jgi:hypothetical protein
MLVTALLVGDVVVAKDPSLPGFRFLGFPRPKRQNQLKEAGKRNADLKQLVKELESWEALKR